MRIVLSVVIQTVTFIFLLLSPTVVYSAKPTRCEQAMTAGVKEETKHNWTRILARYAGEYTIPTEGSFEDRRDELVKQLSLADMKKLEEAYSASGTVPAKLQELLEQLQAETDQPTKLTLFHTTLSRINPLDDELKSFATYTDAWREIATYILEQP